MVSKTPLRPQEIRTGQRTARPEEVHGQPESAR